LIFSLTAALWSFVPENFLSFEPISGVLGATSFCIEDLRWDDVDILHDLSDISHAPLATWFHRWFDPDDERHEPDAELSRIIHFLLIQPNKLSVDFGTAEPEAFWSLLDLLESAGANSIRVTASRASQ
jgi:hypothetical protein